MKKYLIILLTLSISPAFGMDNNEEILIFSDNEPSSAKKGLRIADAQLIKAAEDNNLALAKEAIKAGANVNARDAEGATPLQLANGSEGVEIIKLLIDQGASINSKDDYGVTPLHWTQNATSTKMLLDAGADAKAKTDLGYTPLHWAQTPKMIELLVGAGADINAQTNDGDTPLHRIAFEEKDYAPVVGKLLALGADDTIANDREKTPLFYANNGAIVREFVKAGKNLDITNDVGNTPLHQAPNAEVISALVKGGANINAQNNNDSTPLHLMVIRAEIPQVRALLALGADTSIRDDSGLTALDLAKLNQSKDIIELFQPRPVKSLPKALQPRK